LAVAVYGLLTAGAGGQLEVSVNTTPVVAIVPDCREPVSVTSSKVPADRRSAVACMALPALEGG
jgi:hypothetical protein